MATTWGAHVGIRRLRATDAAAYRRFVSHPQVADLLFEDKGGPLPGTLLIALSMTLQMLTRQPDFGIVDPRGRLIGVIRLWRVSERNRSAMVTIFIGEPADWGKGYGSEAMRLLLRHAFADLNLHRVELNVFDFNDRAIRSYEKVGFVWEGVRRQALRRNGHYHDIVVMGILRSEFERLERVRNSDAP